LLERGIVEGHALIDGDVVDALEARDDVAAVADGVRAALALEVGTDGHPTPADRCERIVIASGPTRLVGAAALLPDSQPELGRRLADQE
jgi:hypothetical protein